MKLLPALLMLSALTTANAATIAVVDSGLDYKHPMIVPNLWTNPAEVEDRRDNDNNGYHDDVHGWNFAEQSGQIIDYKYVGTFSPDCKKYFDIQGKRFLNRATEAELAWMKEKVQDKKFLAEMGKFGNFVHGTHVAGIAIRDSQNVAMGIKLIPTETKLIFDQMRSNKSLASDRWQVLATAFNALAQQQMNLLSEIARFAAHHKADVLNGSFGTGQAQAKMITDNAFKMLFLRKPTEEESTKAAMMFMNALLTHGKRFVASAPDTFFVFAAGNDGTSNDEILSSPANVKADNVITVAATYKNEFIAPFSNYGIKMVDIAAPGMLINSAIPGNDYLVVSGTSQAAPFVANVAAKVKDANPALRPGDIRKILMGTVDKMAFLKGKVGSGGIVNDERAVVAAQMTKTTSLKEAISRANKQIKNKSFRKSNVKFNAEEVTPIPLAPMFQ